MAGAITVVEVITMDGVEAIIMAGAIIAIGKPHCLVFWKKPPSVWWLFHLREVGDRCSDTLASAVGTERTWRGGLTMSAIGGRTDIAQARPKVR
jgi:hypothetical protein